MHGQFLLLKQRVVMNRQKPEQVFRIGAVSGSIFARKIEKAGEPDRIVRSVNLQKRYRDGEGYNFSSSFGLNELPQAIEVLRLALDHVSKAEATVASQDDDFDAGF